MAKLEDPSTFLKESATSFTPLHDKILVRRIEIEGEITRGGIIIPDSAKEKAYEGEVLAVGKGKSNDEGKVFPLDVKAGDSILFGQYAGSRVPALGDDIYVMREEEVLGILKKPPTLEKVKKEAERLQHK
jgi:chaperonin GroES